MLVAVLLVFVDSILLAAIKACRTVFVRLELRGSYDKNDNQRSPNTMNIQVEVRRGAVTCKTCRYLDDVHSSFVILTRQAQVRQN